ncbi:hypothetical protein [Microbacterium sp.]|uniref:hypothetical protein n=1 Tax=Microbacterium sp. TaxID=51671 RepID=UPI0025CE4001|nr:hypothetical protein [Microbacterium sp.]
MARVGGRNAYIAWVVGIGCAATLGALAILAAPLLPASVSWMGTALGVPTAHPVAVEPADGAGAAPTECDQLYGEALWASLRFSAGADLTSSQDPPTTTAAALVGALQPQVRVTCFWTAAGGTVVTTLATVVTDAGALAASALPASGFTCEAHGERSRCTRSDGDLTETIEAGEGLWVSTSERGWHPDGYASSVADQVWR